MTQITAVFFLDVADPNLGKFLNVNLFKVFLNKSQEGPVAVAVSDLK